MEVFQKRDEDRVQCVRMKKLSQLDEGAHVVEGPLHEGLFTRADRQICLPRKRGQLEMNQARKLADLLRALGELLDQAVPDLRLPNEIPPEDPVGSLEIRLESTTGFAGHAPRPAPDSVLSTGETAQVGILDGMALAASALVSRSLGGPPQPGQAQRTAPLCLSLFAILSLRHGGERSGLYFSGEVQISVPGTP